jgi:protoporphyrinogen/coproporphyrinogen III oxidase
MSHRMKVYDDESVDSFLSRRFGRKVARVLGSAMVHGIWAADSRELSVRASFPSLWEVEERGWGGVIRGILRGLPNTVAEGERYEIGGLLDRIQGASVFSFKDGMESLPKRLLSKLKESPNVQVLLCAAVKSLQPEGSGIEVSVNSSIIFHTLKSILPPGAASKRHNPLSKPSNLDHPPSRTSQYHPIICPSSPSQAQPLHERNSRKLHL